MIKTTLARQANQTINALIASIRTCPDGLLFGILPETGRTLADRAAHAIEPIVHELGAEDDSRLTENAWPLRGTFTKDNLIDCAAHIAQVTIPEYLAHNDMDEADGMPQFFVSKLDRVMKVLRHLAHHTGELNWILRQNNVEPGPFIG